MTRLWLVALVSSVALVLPAASLSAGVDKGLSKPPSRLTNYHKAIWMSEWVEWWRVKTLQKLARGLKMPKAKIVTPQQGARMLSIRAMRFLYEDPEEIETALEGCRNGILWRFYH